MIVLEKFRDGCEWVHGCELVHHHYRLSSSSYDIIDRFLVPFLFLQFMRLLLEHEYKKNWNKIQLFHQMLVLLSTLV